MPQYVNNALLYGEIVKWHAAQKKTRPPGTVPLPIYLANACLAIVNEVSSMKQFSGYSFVEDMRQEALLKCVRKACLFDPERSTNPFGFFSRLVWNTFRDVIERETRILDRNHQYDHDRDDRPSSDHGIRPSSPLDNLSYFELRLLELQHRGLPRKEIAAKLKVRRVKVTQVQDSLCRKLRLPRRRSALLKFLSREISLHGVSTS